MANNASNILDSGDLGILARSTSSRLLQIYSDISVDDRIGGRRDREGCGFDDPYAVYGDDGSDSDNTYDSYMSNDRYYGLCSCFLREQGSTAMNLFQNKQTAPESHWKTLLESYHEDIPLSYWLSLGKGRDYAVAMMMLQDRLEELTRKLVRRRSRWGCMEISLELMTISLDPDGFLQTSSAEFLHYHEKLHSRWQMLFHAMGGSIYWKEFHAHCIEMPKILLDMMSSVMKETQQFRPHLYSVTFSNNRFEQEGLMNVAKFLDDNIYLECFDIRNNKIDSLESATRLSNAVRDHPNLRKLDLDHCSIGRNTRILSIMINACANLQELYLSNNCIRSRGAAIVSDFIASNPPFLKVFTLDNCPEIAPDAKINQLGDDDIVILARALKTNTNLKRLVVRNGTVASQAGAEAFNAVIFDYSDMNSVSGSNHTCNVNLWCLGGHITGNTVEQMPIEKKKFHALTTLSPGCDVHFPYFDDVPIELMPKVLEWLHKVPREYSTPLNMVFETMRGCVMPLLFDGRSSSRGGRAQCRKDEIHRTHIGSSRKPKKQRK